MVRQVTGSVYVERVGGRSSTILVGCQIWFSRQFGLMFTVQQIESQRLDKLGKLDKFNKFDKFDNQISVEGPRPHRPRHTVCSDDDQSPVTCSRKCFDASFCSSFQIPYHPSRCDR
ncbi:unnamed protein product [Ambrosiozyma monospora]|uniref:Unnamed protein product n=1 Tax=Ambrosiozyma monospora TaxID=43982 RepID=A0A9W6Z135_AMBMO|nr:unnamed protein product [Ambrosiozyma monospora]